MNDLKKLGYTLFANVGKTLQSYAKISTYLGLAAFVVCFLVEIFSGFDYGGLLMLSGLGAAVSLYFSALFIYAFGQITIDVHDMKNRSNEGNSQDNFELPII